MRVLPAIDLKGGRVVQLVGGVPGTEQVILPDPAKVARDWVAQGAPGLHVVDLDAALGTGDNRAAVEFLVREAQVPIQVGGGVRTTERVEALLALGADRVVVGTRGVEDPAWLEAVATRHPTKVVLALDAKKGRVVTKGWAAATDLTPAAVAKRVAKLPLAGILATCVDVEGRLQGLDRRFVEELVAASSHPLIASGGVTTADDVAFLRRAGAESCVVGLALYTGRLRLADALEAARSPTP